MKRTGGGCAALSANTRPDDRVLDLGTGTADVAILEATRGGAKTVLRSVKVILLELGAVQYNQGAPMWLEVHLELDKLGFMAYDVLELHYDHRTQVLTQVDVLFVRKGSFLTRKRATGFPAPVLPDITCSVKASAGVGGAETPERSAGTGDHKGGPQSGAGLFGWLFG